MFQMSQSCANIERRCTASLNRSESGDWMPWILEVMVTREGGHALDLMRYTAVQQSSCDAVHDSMNAASSAATMRRNQLADNTVSRIQELGNKSCNNPGYRVCCCMQCLFLSPAKRTRAPYDAKPPVHAVLPRAAFHMQNVSKPRDIFLLTIWRRCSGSSILQATALAHAAGGRFRRTKENVQC
ncbi:hypothetical protein IQ06DRAFT_311422 [Phaeosphaeriaceae sp. SRC1lsM3a]|nr:hypothetical protein IQ06DRAFT_311422 [Stagonospora sp. SRC1lsM3a]